MTNLKFIAETFQKAGKFEEYQKISDLMEKNKELEEKNIKLEKEKEKLSEKLNLKENMEKRNDAYWKKSNNDGPFCPRCWEKDKEPISMIPFYKGSNRAACPVCKTTVNFTGKEDGNEAILPKYNDLDPYD